MVYSLFSDCVYIWASSIQPCCRVRSTLKSLHCSHWPVTYKWLPGGGGELSVIFLGFINQPYYLGYKGKVGYNWNTVYFTSLTQWIHPYFLLWQEYLCHLASAQKSWLHPALHNPLQSKAPSPNSLNCSPCMDQFHMNYKTYKCTLMHSNCMICVCTK